MNLVLSWNLFIIVIFVVIVAYSFIIGLNRTLKTLIGAYLATLTADGLGNLFQQYVLSGDTNVTKVFEVFDGDVNETMIITKVVIFIIVVVILSVKGAYEVEANGFVFGGANAIVTGLFGFLTAGLIVSTLLVYVSGFSFVQAGSISSNIVDIYSTSDFVRAMVDYYNFWFSIPVVALVIWSLFFARAE